MERINVTLTPAKWQKLQEIFPDGVSWSIIYDYVVRSYEDRKMYWEKIDKLIELSQPNNTQYTKSRPVNQKFTLSPKQQQRADKIVSRIVNSMSGDWDWILPNWECTRNISNLFIESDPKEFREYITECVLEKVSDKWYDLDNYTI